MKREIKPELEDALIEKVRIAMGWRSRAKTLRWFATFNPELGGLCPDDLIEDGRAAELKEYIERLEIRH